MNLKGKLNTVLLVFLMVILAIMPLTMEENTSFVKASDDSKTPTESAKVASDETAQLTKKIDEILNDERLDGAIAGVSIRNAGNGAVLYSHDSDIRLHPASNEKIITGASALDVLGPDYRFSTEVLTDGEVKGKVLKGNLYLKGKGDPTLMKKDLTQFAKELKKKGIHKIKGDLIGDDSWFDDVRLSTDLNWDDEPYYTGAQVSALTIAPNDDYDAGTVIVEVYPGEEAEAKPKIKLVPETDYLTIVNKAKTVGKNESKDISIEREHGTNRIVIEGNIPVDGSRSRVWRSVWEPTGYALDVFRKSLEEQGIRLIGNSKVKVGVTPEDATVLTSRKSMPLEELYIPFLKLSNNGHAEVLAKQMGKSVHGEGSWDKGIEVMEDKLAKYGVNTDTVMLRDGSGMSHKNLIPAEELTKFLYEIQDESWFPVFKNALPVAGEPERLVGGTLRDRMTGESTKGNVIAKTGSLTGVSTLSGYVTSKDGKKLIFSIMMNNYKTGSMTELQDEIATVLAKHEFE
ncbi:D-alanyl-D-alanine carboxypeptidase/D-alanyl-D-alanine-endopeptidase [Virgibacillus phasianinus]|uniref:D-alanyl-D-alanine carboxypeptidase/D-alanyl-D-alanine-endopeptidase n=1 Tax=Virgibacillus phasianinus TaxID=2017483 RepID=A0A220U0B5_9BACI|nr:D-alanyl-D-alanine carboxypeptidase/D-alanyl-D-alanine-endopeptidase [Virgibacillus phasianinus]ASK61557.1 D-alanyl-D-alanine carboxypeptidase/D-alanyl-D-alanine-endopeptidase [Virgibacillus phasianinus]